MTPTAAERSSTDWEIMSGNLQDFEPSDRTAEVGDCLLQIGEGLDTVMARPMSTIGRMAASASRRTGARPGVSVRAVA